MSEPVVLLDWAEYGALLNLHAAYSAALDSGQWELWPEFFTADAVYKLIPRENHERGFPLATLAFDSQAMLRDRVYGIRETLFHDPYYQRHVVGAPLVRVRDPQGRLHCETQYAVFRTKLDGPSTVFNVGRYLDIVQPTAAGLRLAQRLCVYDSEMIPNSIIYPI